MENWNYQKAGVDVTAGYEAVRLMKRHVERTRIPGMLGGLGGFGGCFELPEGFKRPVLVSGTDSVGTKLAVACMTGIHNTVGIDCVAMCVNDILCQGAKPLFFLDYIGIGRLDPNLAASLVEGVSEGCVQAGCALVGGETAELPGLYKPGEYDLAGFAVGVVEKERLIDGSTLKAGDALIGIASSGLHSNGFSLVRKLCFEKMGLQIEQYIEPLSQTLGETLLTPTKIYASLMSALNACLTVKGAAHVTGGGWLENIPRLLGGQEGLKTVVHKGAVQVPPIFGLLKEWGNVSDPDLYNTFNMGVGLVVAVDREDADAVIAVAQEQGESAYRLGEVAVREAGEEPITIV